MINTPAMDACIRTNDAGFDYHELTCMYPFLQNIYAPFEMNYNPVPVRDFMVDNPWIPILACALYGLGIIVGQSYFKERNAWNWRSGLAVWNFALSAFSTIGFWRILPHVIHNCTHYSLAELMCIDPETNYGCGSTGLWAQMFVLSKFPELFDTLFIVVHKKKLIFLHWYHHVTVLLYCWHSYVTKAPAGLFFVCMNYGVHAIMYFYYFLMATKTINPKSWAMLITCLQISQMIVGVILTLVSFAHLPLSRRSDECNLREENTQAAFIMYGSYLFLFLQFFIGRYFGPKKGKTKPNKVVVVDTTKKMT